MSSEKVDSYGPATSAVMYEEIRGVGSKPQVAVTSSSCTMGSGWGVGDDLPRGRAVTVNWNVALRSGCSKTAKTRRESGTSNWE